MSLKDLAHEFKRGLIIKVISYPYNKDLTKQAMFEGLRYLELSLDDLKELYKTKTLNEKAGRDFI